MSKRTEPTLVLPSPWTSVSNGIGTLLATELRTFSSTDAPILAGSWLPKMRLFTADPPQMAAAAAALCDGSRLAILAP